MALDPISAMPQCQLNTYHPSAEKSLVDNARRETVEPRLLEQLKCMKKQELKSLNRCDSQNDAFAMMRSLLPSSVPDDMILNECHYICNALQNAARDFVANPNFRPCRKPVVVPAAVSSFPVPSHPVARRMDAMDAILVSDENTSVNQTHRSVAKRMDAMDAILISDENTSRSDAAHLSPASPGTRVEPIADPHTASHTASHAHDAS